MTRFYALTDNTSNHLPMHAANNFPYGAPPKREDNEMDYGESADEDVPEESSVVRLSGYTPPSL